MSTMEKTQDKASSTRERPGLFRRMMDRLDRALQAKAEAKAKEGCCCGGGDKDKGDKCC